MAAPGVVLLKSGDLREAGKAKADEEADEEEEDAASAATATYILNRQDHTAANALKTSLLKDEAVVFAAYNMPHPLEAVVHLRVQTSGAPAGAAVERALQRLIGTCTDLKASFAESLKAYKERAPYGVN